VNTPKHTNSRILAWVVSLLVTAACRSLDGGAIVAAPCQADAGADADAEWIGDELHKTDVALSKADCVGMPPEATILVATGHFPEADGLRIPINSAKSCASMAGISGVWRFDNSTNQSQNPSGAPTTPISLVKFTFDSCDPFYVHAEEVPDGEGNGPWSWPHLSMLDTAAGHHESLELMEWEGCAAFLVRRSGGVLVDRFYVGLVWMGKTGTEAVETVQIQATFLGQPKARLTRVAD
jgi:hypothetical protein